MHPEIYRELILQHGREMRGRAHQARLARMAHQARRATRRGLNDREEFVVSAVPDYVDGSFRATPAEDQSADRVATTGRAAWGSHDRRRRLRPFRNVGPASELFISPKTASVHVSNILGKLGAATRGEAAAKAHTLRLFDSAASAGQ
jgi:Bacterial regulatory proteins, luxR family